MSNLDLIKTPYSFFLTFISIFFFFLISNNNAFEWPTSAEIPILERVLNPEFLLNDFYTNSATNSPKIFFSYFVNFFTYLGLDYNQVLYAIKFIVNVFTPVLIFIIFIRTQNIFYNFKDTNNEILKNNFLLLSAFIMALPFFGIVQGYGNTKPFGWEAIQSIFPIIPMKLSFFIGLIYILMKLSDKNYKTAPFVLLLSFIIHPSVGSSFLLITTIIFIFSKISYAKKLYIFYDFLIGIVLPTILILICFDNSVTVTSKEFFNLFIELRHPHHYLVSKMFTSFSIIWFLISCLPLIFSLLLRNKKLILFSACLQALLYLSVIIQYVFSEIYPIILVMQFGPIRFTTFSTLLISLNLILILSYVIENKLVKGIRKFDDSLERLYERNPISFLFNLKYGFSLILLAGLFVIFSYEEPYTKYKNKHNLNELSYWIKNNTSYDDQFITKDIDTVFFRAYLKRSIVADGMMPFTNKSIQDFSKRFDLYNNIHSLNLVQLACDFDDYKMDYFLTKDYFNDASLMFSSDNWFIYDLRLINC